MVELLYCSSTCLSSEKFADYLTVLPIKMQEYICKYRNDKDRKHRLLARLILRHCLIQTTGSDALLEQWQTDANNKPFLSGWFDFSISHAGEFVLFTYASDNIGVDIEEINSNDCTSIISFLHPEEQEFISKAENAKEKRFYAIWTKKEAVLKAMGIGISNGMQQFSCVKEQLMYNNQTWYFYPIAISRLYACHICTKTELLIIKAKEFKL